MYHPIYRHDRRTSTRSRGLFILCCFLWRHDLWHVTFFYLINMSVDFTGRLVCLYDQTGAHFAIISDVDKTCAVRYVDLKLQRLTECTMRHCTRTEHVHTVHWALAGCDRKIHHCHRQTLSRSANLLAPTSSRSRESTRVGIKASKPCHIAAIYLIVNRKVCMGQRFIGYTFSTKSRG